MAFLGLPSGTDDTGAGQFFLILVYGFILFKAAVLIGSGSEKLLLIYGPGIVGGLLIPILGAIPDAAIVLVSGLQSNAQCSVATGVGTLAGSTIMLLTIPFAFSIFAGVRDMNADGNAASFPNGKPKYTNGFQIRSSCVTVFRNTTYAARIMIATCVLYLIILIPAIVLKNKSLADQARDEHWPALFTMIGSGIGFIVYSIFQIVDSNATLSQEMKQQKLKFLQWKQKIGARVASTKNGIKLAFDKFDKDGNGNIDIHELHEGFARLGLELDRSQVKDLMKNMDVDHDGTLSLDEFQNAVNQWSQSNKNVMEGVYNASRIVNNITGSADLVYSDKHSNKEEKEQQIIAIEEPPVSIITEDVQNTSKSSLLKKNKKTKYSSVVDEDDDEVKEDMISDVNNDDPEYILSCVWRELQQEEENEEEFFWELSDKQLITRALIQLIVGTVLVVIFSDPMVAVIDNFAVSISVSSFYVSFIITPIASNASEIYAAILFASKRTTEGISMSFSALYGAACMNSTMVLCIFAALVYFKHLEWTFITETLVILMTMLVVGFIGMKQTVVAWKGFVTISLFPLSLIFVALLDPYLDDDTGCS